MQIRAFDFRYNVVTIFRTDVIRQIWINKHFEYHTLTQTYHGARNTKEEAELQASVGFFKVSTSDIINVKFIEQFVKDGVFVSGIFYKLSRRKLADLKKQLRKYIPNSH